MKPLLSKYFEVMKKNAYDNELHFYKYPRIHDKQPHSIHLKLRFDQSRTYDAWGNGLDSDEAFGKAFMELIERYKFASFSPFNYKNLFGFFKKETTLFEISEKYNIPINYLHPTNSNGVAIHSSKKKAMQAAFFELLERHCILFAILEDIPPQKKITLEITKNRSCDFYIWNGPLNTNIVVGAYKKEQGWYFSSSCSVSLDEAIKKASLEINSFLSLDESLYKITDFKIGKDDIDSFNKYYRFSGDQRIISFLNTKSSKTLPNLNKKDFFYTIIPQPYTFKDLISLPCVRVINPYTQQLFFDNWDTAYLNPLLFDKDMALPDYPHIIA